MVDYCSFSFVFATDHPIDTACAPDLFAAYYANYYLPAAHFFCDL